METENVKVQITKNALPYIYLKISDDSNRYRLSANYRYINEHYNFKMNFIRNLDNIFPQNNKIFTIQDNKINISSDIDKIVEEEIEEIEEIVVGKGLNTLNIIKIIIGCTSIILFKRIYHDDENHSLFFASTKYNTINQFLEEL